MSEWDKLWETQPKKVYLFKDHGGYGYPSILLDKFLWDVRAVGDKNQQKLNDIRKIIKDYYSDKELKIMLPTEEYDVIKKVLEVLGDE